jgi:hypothetical protein
MDINLLRLTLKSLLDEYEGIGDETDLLKYVVNIESEESIINNLDNLIDLNGIGFEELQVIYNLLKKDVEVEVGSDFFSTQFKIYSFNRSPWLIRIKVYAFANELISLFEYGYFSEKYALWITKEKPELKNLLKNHLMWYYREKILTCILHQVDPNHYNPNDVPLSQTWPHSTNDINELNSLLWLPKKSVEPLTFLHLWENPPIENHLKSFFSSVYYGNVNESEIEKFIVKETIGFQTEGFEFFLDDVLRYIISIQEDIKPNPEEILTRKTELLQNGKKVPVIKIHDIGEDDNRYVILEEAVDDLEKLFPEIYEQLNHLYRFRDSLVERIKGNYKIEENNLFAINQSHHSPPHHVVNGDPENLEAKQPENLDEIFKDPNIIEPCINILRQLENPLIDESYNYIGKNKTLVCIWLEELLKNSFIKKYRDKRYVILLNRKFPGLDMTKDGSLFRKTSKRAEEKRKDIQVLLSQLSLSGK